jgi:hypothetical protein
LSKTSLAADAATMGYNIAVLNGYNNGAVPNALYNTRLGYYQVLADNTAFTKLDHTGKVWGRLGQGSGNVPATAKPFYWTEAANTLTDGSPSMLISYFPHSETDTGLAAADKIISASAKAVIFESVTAWVAPVQPAQAASPAPGLSGAKMLAAGVISAAAAFVSLY